LTRAAPNALIKLSALKSKRSAVLPYLPAAASAVFENRIALGVREICFDGDNRFDRGRVAHGRLFRLAAVSLFARRVRTLASVLNESETGDQGRN
jgi:hypothetical protein